MEVNIFGEVIVEDKPIETKVEKPSPFSFSNNISDKKYPTSLDGYNAYLMNLSFSQRQDTVLYANEMNKYHSLPEKAQFDFYYYGLPKKKYFAKWAKASKEANLGAVRDYYRCSDKEAISYIRVLTEPQLLAIVEWSNQNKGGVNAR